MKTTEIKHEQNGSYIWSRKTQTKENKCHVCGDKINRESPQETFGTVSNKWFVLNGKVVNGHRLYLCGNCILDVICHIREMERLRSCSYVCKTQEEN